MSEFRSTGDREPTFTQVGQTEYEPGLTDPNRQAQNRSEFADLYQRAKQAGSLEEQIALLRDLDSRLREVVTPDAAVLSTTNMSDKVLVDTYLEGAAFQGLWIGAGTMGQRIYFEDHRSKPGAEDTDLTTEDGKPGWMRYTRPSGSIGVEEWQHYADYFGALDGYVQVVPDDEIKEEQW